MKSKLPRGAIPKPTLVFKNKKKPLRAAAKVALKKETNQ